MCVAIYIQKIWMLVPICVEGITATNSQLKKTLLAYAVLSEYRQLRRDVAPLQMSIV